MAIVTRDELEGSLAAIRATVTDPREGILGPRSIVWQFGSELGLFLGGGRAALLQLAHPMVAYAIDHHSSTRNNVVGRFQRTFHNVFAMVFGDLDTAFIAARRVHAIHNRITGTIAETIGGWPAGTRYDANDPEALRWVHATLVDTTLTMCDRFGERPSIDIKNGYVTQMNRFAALFGIPERLLPSSYAEHEAYMTRMLGSDMIAVAPCAREMGRFLVGRGGSHQTPFGRMLEAITASLLPERLAREFEIRASPALVRAGLGLLGRVQSQLPRAIVTMPAKIDAERRIAGLRSSKWSAWTERQLFQLARRATGAD
ncbi:MAG: oxygenase MpaB family protein [Kofleriaceae bacterium]